MKKTFNKIIRIIAGITFVFLFACLASLNGWFFYDLGSKIPLSDEYNLAIPFLIMGVAISIIASLTSMVYGKVSLIAGLAFHALSIGITYTSTNFALDSQSIESSKGQLALQLAKEKARLADQKLNQSNKQAEAAKAGIGNPDTAKIMQMQAREIEAVKNKRALNSNGNYAGTVWEVTNGCTKTKGFYARNYRQDCDDINKNIPYKYKNMLVQASKVGTALIQGQKALDNKQKALSEQQEAIKNQKPTIELPVIVDDEKLNKQYVTLIIAVMFETALIILEWLISGKIGLEKPSKKRKNAGMTSVRNRYDFEKNGTTSRTGRYSSIIHLFGATDLLRTIRAKNRTIARRTNDLKKKEKALKKAEAELNKMPVVSGAKLMRQMQGWHIMKVFNECGKRVNQQDAAVIALICRTYKAGDTLGIQKVYKAVSELPECADKAPSRKQITDAIDKMRDVLVYDEKKQKTSVARWIDKPELVDKIGEMKIAA